MLNVIFLLSLAGEPVLCLGVTAAVGAVSASRTRPAAAQLRHPTRSGGDQVLPTAAIKLGETNPEGDEQPLPPVFIPVQAPARTWSQTIPGSQSDECCDHC